MYLEEKSETNCKATLFKCIKKVNKNNNNNNKKIICTQKDFFNLLGSSIERIFGENDLIMLLIMLHVLLVGWLDMFIVFCESKPRDLNTKYCCIALKGREHKKFESVG